jgi:rhodanese-related sulfurtransferase/tetratricopeptide (TPR) repeat protein
MVRRGGAVSLLCLALLLVQPGGPSGAAPKAPSVRERAAAYEAARARAGDFLLSPLEVVERMLARRPMTVLDIRARRQFAAAHLRGARSLPFRRLLRAIRSGDVGGRGLLVVVDEGDNQAIEAMVALRLTGRPAYAMAGGMASLRRLLAGSLEVPKGSPLAGRGAQARALLVGAGAQAALDRSDPSRGQLLGWGLAAALVATVLLLLRARLVRRRRRPLVEAFELLQNNREQSFGAAATRLQGALAGRLSRRERAEARFGLAYARARLGQLRRATDELDQLIASGQRDPSTLYLDLWVKVRYGDDKEAAARYEEYQEVLARLPHSRYLASIAFLRLGRSAFAHRKVDDAIKRFDQIRDLTVLAGRVPAGYRQLPVAVGVELLLDNDVPGAADRFNRAAQGAEEGSELQLTAQLGSLLCRWRQDEAGRAIGVERELTSVLERVRAGAAAAGADDERERWRLLVRDLLLWQAVACVAGWQRLPLGQGLPAVERERLRQRIDELGRADPDLADPYLLDGLVGYAFGVPGPEQDRAVEALDQARNRGVDLPEVLWILAREQDRTGRPAGDPADWADPVRDYLSDATTPLELRRRLQLQEAGLTRHAPLLPEDLQVTQVQRVPTLQDLRNRSQLLQRRVRRLLGSGGGEDGNGTVAACQLLERLEAATRLLDDAANTFTDAEWELVALAGRRLLGDEA